MEDLIKGPNTILETIIDKGLLLPALSYSWWMPVEAKVTYRISEILIDLKKIPDDRIFHYVDKTHTQEWEDSIYEIDHQLLGKGQIKRNNIKEELKNPWSPDIPKESGKTKFVQDLKTENWYILFIFLRYENQINQIEQLHLSIVSIQNKILRELMAIKPYYRHNPLWTNSKQYPLIKDTDEVSFITLTKKTVDKTLSAILPYLKPL